MSTTLKDQNQTTTTTPRATPDQRFESPSVNIYETKESYVLKAEMPDVNKGGLDIGVEDNILTLHGRRQITEPAAESLHHESSRYDYRRVFELDPAIDVAKIDARIDQGILTLTLPKSERVKPRKVTVSD